MRKDLIHLQEGSKEYHKNLSNSQSPRPWFPKYKTQSTNHYTLTFRTYHTKL